MADPTTPAGTGSALRAALDRSEDRPAPPAVQPDVEFFCFRIRQTRFAVSSGYVSEVVRLPPVTTLPGASPFLLGVAAHRGEVIPVVDLSRLLGMGTASLTGRTRAAIARADGMVVLLIADQLEGLRTVPSTSVMPPPLGGEGPVEFISGVLSDARGTLSVLDLPRMLSSARARTVGK
jgi:purine-binding chemotaxis protein CheW